MQTPDQMVLMVYSATPIGPLRATVERRIREEFPNAAEISGSEGREGWNVDLLLWAGSDARIALTSLLRVLGEMPLPNDTYVVFDGTEEYCVFLPESPDGIPGDGRSATGSD